MHGLGSRFMGKVLMSLFLVFVATSLAHAQTDILWRNTSTGEDVVWYMNGVTLTGSTDFYEVMDQTWTIVGVGDFNGDGKPDILWRNTSTGEDTVWYMNGVTLTNWADLYRVTDQTWTIVGVGDFNGDGKPDIVWRNISSGNNVVWYMNGANLTSWVSLLTIADQTWTIVGVGDFNGDGKPDILWRNISTGSNLVWYMNGVTMTSYAALSTVTDPAWTIVGVGDFNGDGKPDILWRNISNGSNVVWYMNGVSMTSWVALPANTDPNWKIVGTGSFTSGAPIGTAPSAPTGATATAGNGQVIISWNAVSGATSYNIYWSTTSGVTKSTGTKISNVTSPYTLTGLTNGTPYYYVVTAVNSYGESAESSQASATPSGSPATAQTWILNFGDGPCNQGQETATVVVEPFTNSGTFSETSSSPGLWVWDPSCGCKYRLLFISASVAHNSPGDSWSFTLGGAGCGMQSQGSGSGTANGNFPNATFVNGSATTTTQSPLGQTSGSAAWQGTRQ